MPGLLMQVAAALLRTWRTDAAIRELSLLSDHRLADLGLRREELPLLRLGEPRARAEKAAQAPWPNPNLVPCG